MQVEKDLIKREIQKLNLLLTNLIKKISRLNLNNAESGIKEISKTLKSELDLTLEDFTQMENSEFLKKVEKLHESHIEKLTSLIYEIIIKTEKIDLGNNHDKIKIAQKGILLIDFLNEKSNTFSMERMNIRNILHKICFPTKLL